MLISALLFTVVFIQFPVSSIILSSSPAVFPLVFILFQPRTSYFTHLFLSPRCTLSAVMCITTYQIELLGPLDCKSHFSTGDNPLLNTHTQTSSTYNNSECITMPAGGKGSLVSFLLAWRPLLDLLGVWWCTEARLLVRMLVTACFWSSCAFFWLWLLCKCYFLINRKKEKQKDLF